MARKKKHPEHVNHERWLVSYADFITLLFAFFVVMFAASNSDQKKAGQIARAIDVAFKDLAIFPPTGKLVPLYDTGGVPSDTNNLVGNTHSQFDASQIIAASKPGNGTGGADGKEMTKVRAQIEKKIEEQLANGTIRLNEDSRGLTVSLNEAGFFDPGSAVIHSEALPIIDKIAATLKAVPNSFRVEGHTDNTPIHTAQFPSNWELSTARATFLLEYLLTKNGVPPDRLSAVGYGEYRPVASNATAEGRAANRRVDLVILGAAAQRLEPAAKQ